MICPLCAKKNRLQARYCINCGAPLKPDSSGPEALKLQMPAGLPIYQLLIYDGTAEPQHVPVSRGRYSLGRSAKCMISLKHPTVSGFHLLLEVEEEAVWVEDLDSTNGTFLNGERIHQKTRLETGMNLNLGPATLLQLEELPADDTRRKAVVLAGSEVDLHEAESQDGDTRIVTEAGQPRPQRTTKKLL